MSAFVHPVVGTVKLGRTLLRRNRSSKLRAAALHNFLTTIPDDFAPAEFDNTNGITDWGMMLNSTLGDCTIACPGHMLQAWTARSGKEITVPDSIILKGYEDWDGYVDGDPSTDNGGDILTVCNDWEKYGLGTHFISAHAEINMTQLRWQQALYIFGAINGGVALPISAQAQVGSTWDIVGDGESSDSAPNSWGGHCVAIVGYDADGVTLVTWGQLQRATWRFVMWYFDEARACLSPEWTDCPLPTDKLASALQQIGV